MALKLMGKKLGMTHLFDEQGNIVVCTVIEVEPNVVVQIKTAEKDGYSAIQTGYGKITAKNQHTVEKRVTKPRLGHFKKAGVEPRRHLAESKVDNAGEYSLGQEIGVGAFTGTTFVDATAISIGKGYQGAMKLHNFSGMRKTHGAGPTHRHLGSTGNRSTPGRCFPGGERASHMGYDKVTIQNLKVVEVNEEENLIVVKGSVPGPKNGLVTLTKAIKRAA
jgi:large subunit ribosomal protein L3